MSPAELALRELAAGGEPVIDEAVIADIRDSLVSPGTIDATDAVTLLLLAVDQRQAEVNRLKRCLR